MSDLFNAKESDAVISDCGKYRYLLRRVWDQQKPRALLVMLNPSTADASTDDPTIKSCIRLTNGLGFGGFEVVNLYAWRATDPAMLAHVADPIGKNNDGVIAAAINRWDIPICAWGKNAGHSRARAVYEALTAQRPAAFCFDMNKDGSPKHPLYIKSGTQLQTFRFDSRPTQKEIERG